MEVIEKASAVIGYVMAGVSVSAGLIFAFVRISHQLGFLKESEKEGGVREFLSNFH